MGSHSTPARAKPSLASRLGDLLLTLLAVAGSLCLLLVILSFTLNISIMMFKTGSMSPTITAGSIALVKEIPASELEVGDIATVQRGQEELPVTHRVTGIQDITADGTVTFTMKGDGNDTPDVAPYHASTVQRVFFSVPGLAPLLQKFNSPYVLSALTLGAASLVVWAFWPRDEKKTTENHPGKIPYGGLQAAVLPALLFASVTVSYPLQPSEEPTDLVTGQYLRMATLPSAKMKNMSPGDSATWVVDTWSEAPGDGTIELSILTVLEQSDAVLPLVLAVTNCAVQPGLPLASGCPENTPRETKHFNAPDLNTAKEQKIVAFSASSKQRVVITGHLVADSAKAVQDASATILLSASGSGETISTSPDDTPNSSSHPKQESQALPPTGVENMLLLSVLGLLVLALGTILTRRSKDSGDTNA